MAFSNKANNKSGIEKQELIKEIKRLSWQDNDALNVAKVASMFAITEKKACYHCGLHKKYIFAPVTKTILQCQT
jgi:hypothetical protein